MNRLECIREKVRQADLVTPVGRVTDMVGMVVVVEGLSAPVGSLCHIDTGRDTEPLACEVVGFRNGSLLVMPYQGRTGVAAGCLVELVAGQVTAPVGDALLGRVLDGMGRPLDGGPSLVNLQTRPVQAAAPPALTRRRD